MHIDHTTIRTQALEQTRDFLLSVFELREGPRPAVIADNMRGYWLYWNDAPLIHIIESSLRQHPGMDHGAEAIDHTAFFLENYEGFRQKLERLNVRYSTMDITELGEKRIFIRTPTGILLEIVFRAAL